MAYSVNKSTVDMTLAYFNMSSYSFESTSVIITNSTYYVGYYSSYNTTLIYIMGYIQVGMPNK